MHPAGRCLRAGKVNGDQETRLRETADFALLNESTFRSRYAIQRKLSHELIFPTRRERRIIRAAGKPNLMKIARQIQFIVIERPKVTNKPVIKIIQLNGSGWYRTGIFVSGELRLKVENGGFSRAGSDVGGEKFRVKRDKPARIRSSVDDQRRNESPDTVHGVIGRKSNFQASPRVHV